MIFSYEKNGICVETDDYQPLVIVAERESTLVQIISDIHLALAGSDEFILISEKEKEINLSKEAAIIVDPWNIDCNAKNIRTKLYQYLIMVSQEQTDERFLRLRTDLCGYIEDLSEHVPYYLSYNMNIDPTGLFKYLDVGIMNTEGDVIDRLVEYIKIMQSLCGIRILFLVNICLFLSSEQIALLYKEAMYINLQLILVEHAEKGINLKEKKVIIDSDDCIIYL